eukprot:gene13374-19219_t
MSQPNAFRSFQDQGTLWVENLRKLPDNFLVHAIQDMPKQAWGSLTDRIRQTQPRHHRVNGLNPQPSSTALHFLPLPLASLGRGGGVSVATQTLDPVAAPKASAAPQASDSAPPSQGATSKAELGRATWTFLHTLAAQYPDQPSRQQQKDVKQLVDILTRIYPCSECAGHFKEIVSIGKPTFNCNYVGARWSPLDCDAESGGVNPNGCDMTVGRGRGRRT